MKKLFLKSFALVAMLLCGLTASAEGLWCEKRIGHFTADGSDGADPNSYVLLTVMNNGDGTITFTIANDPEKNTKDVDYILINPGYGTAGADVDSNAPMSQSVTYTLPDGITELKGVEILWSNSGWPGRWMVQNLDIAVSDMCSSLDNVNFALAENGAKAWASSGTAANANDGDKGTRWESEHKVDPQWFVVNLGQQREFNTVQLLWEGAYGKSFTIDYSTDSTTWTNFATIADQTLSGFPYLQTLTVDNPVTAQYVRFVGTARGDMNYGYSFWEFQVLKATEDVLTTVELKAAAAIAKVNEGVALTVTGKNQNGAVMSEYGEVQYTVSPADAGAVVDGKYVPAKQGPATIVAAVGEVKSAEVSVFGYEGDNVALSTNIDTDNKVIAQSEIGSGTDAFFAVDGNEGSVWQGSATNGTDADEASRTYDSWFVLDLGAKYDINLITIKFEGACSDAYHVDALVNNTDWVVMHNFAKTMGVNGHTDYIYGENLTNNTGVRYVRFWSTKASTQWGMKMYEMKVFATETKTPSDPTAIDATEVASKVTKTIENGQLVIIREGVKYNVVGSVIEK